MHRLGRRDWPVRSSTIVLLELAEKENSSDVRESLATRVARSPLSPGARVSAIDGHVLADRLAEEAPRLGLGAHVMQASDVMVLTDHDDIHYRLVQREARWIPDCQNRLSGANVESL